MYKHKWHAAVTLLVLWAVSTSVCTAADEQAKLPPKDKLHVYLLMGQSNVDAMRELGKRYAAEMIRLTKP